MNRNKQLVLENVSSVYSGVNGRCCCGCAGKHTYAQAHRRFASANRGYPVTDEEISDRSVKLIVGKIQKAGTAVAKDDLVYAVVGKRLYVAYLKTS